MLFMFHVCLYYRVLSIPCSLVITCWGRADLLCVMVPYVFVTFPYDVWNKLWNLIAGLSHPFLGMGPGPMEFGKLAAFRLKLGNLTLSLCMTFPVLD